MKAFEPKPINNYARDDRDNINYNFRHLSEFGSEAFNFAHESLVNSELAKAQAGRAEEKADRVRAEFDEIVSDGDSNAEVAAARVATDGESKGSLSTRIDFEVNRIDTKDNTLTYNIMYPPSPLMPPSGNGVDDDVNKIKAILNALPRGARVHFPALTFKLSAELIIEKQVYITAHKPAYDGEKLVGGTILDGAGILVKNDESSNFRIENIGVYAPNRANAFEVLGGRVSSGLFIDCVGIARDHGFIVQSYQGEVEKISIIRCVAAKAIHGFSVKAADILLQDCQAYDCPDNGFGIVGDNLRGDIKAQSIRNRMINCFAFNCIYGLKVYARDYKSEDNASQIVCSGHVISNFSVQNCTVAMRLGDPTAAVPSGQTYVAVEDTIVDGLVQTGSVPVGENISIELNHTKNVSVSGVVSPYIMRYNADKNTNLRIDTAGIVSNNAKPAARYTDFVRLEGTIPNVSVGSGLFTTGDNGEITNFVGGREDRMIYLVFRDDNTVIRGTGNFFFRNRFVYEGKGSWVLLKYQDGVWFDVAGHCVSRGTQQRNLVSNSSPIRVDHFPSVIDIVGSGTTTNRIDFEGKNDDSEVITLIIRATTDSFTFGGFSNKFVVPNDFPTTVRYGNAIVSQWIYFNATGKWLCIHSGPIKTS
ncbi:hypothetical protein NSR02_07240 [Bacillus sp. FSL W8-1122]